MTKYDYEPYTSTDSCYNTHTIQLVLAPDGSPKDDVKTYDVLIMQDGVFIAVIHEIRQQLHVHRLFKVIEE